jgi:uncharacterized phage protein (TIGR02216 family)
MRIDWAGLLRVGLARPEAGGLGLTPAQFWALSPVELKLMLGLTEAEAPMGRARLAELLAQFPDDFER